MGTEQVELAGCSWRVEVGEHVRVAAFFLVPLDVDVDAYPDAVAAAMRAHTPWGDTWTLRTEYAGERPDLEAAWSDPEELDLWAPVNRPRLRRVDQWRGTFTTPPLSAVLASGA